MNQALNPQVSDAIAEVSQRLTGADGAFLMPAIYQSAAQGLVLGLQNAVAQQQRTYILRNAITAAAATAILQGKPAEADALLERLAESTINPGSLGDEIKIFLDALTTLADQLNPSKGQESAL